MEIQHFTHQEHPLFLKDDESTTINQSIACGICARPNIAPPFYVCESCQYYLHKSCANLPQTLHHSFHPSHPLTLLTHEDYACDSCHRYFDNAPTFRCKQCYFDMDVECAVMPPITFTEVDQKNIIQHFSHQHPMPLVEVNNKDEINCFGCQLNMCNGDRVYGCAKCKYFLHKSCAEFPKEIQYPFHLDHGPLVLRIKHFGFECMLCGKSYETGTTIFTFICNQCQFQLCVKCSTKRGTIKYEYHEHLLCFAWERDTPISQCSNYDSYCKQPVFSNCKELSYTSPYAFYCLECDFKVHLLCGLLPSMIKHECHVDPLILVDSFIEDNSGEYYCHVCETKRDLRIRVYYCEECKYTAHVHCVASEIINVLRGDLRDVELKPLGQDFWKLAQEEEVDIAAIVEEEQDKSPLISLKDVINALTEEEQRSLNQKYKWDHDYASSKEKYNDDNAESKLGDEDINRILQLSRFTFEDFENLYEELCRFFNNTKLELKSSDLGLKIVTVKGYMIPHTLAPVMKALLWKYGDVSSKSDQTSTKEWKSLVYFILCKVLKSMSSTKVADLTLNLIQEWFFHLAVVLHEKFEIKFAFAHVERLVRAFLGQQAKRLEDEIPAMINDKIEKLQQEITKEKSRLEKCEEYRGSSEKSEFMKDCLNEASEMKWKDASEDLFTDDDPKFKLFFS